MPPDRETLLRQLVEVHNHGKGLYLTAEELDGKRKCYVQPIKEWRDALEHHIRGIANELGLDGSASPWPNEKYVEDCLRKALGHEYRAFFDTADWLAVELRDRIEEALEPYSIDTISTVLPEFYPQTQGEIVQLSLDIAKIREEKDISRRDGILAEVLKYKDRLQALIRTWGKVRSALPALEACSKKERRARWASRFWDIAIGVVVGLVLALLGYLGTKGLR